MERDRHGADCSIAADIAKRLGETYSLSYSDAVRLRHSKKGAITAKRACSDPEGNFCFGSGRSTKQAFASVEIPEGVIVSEWRRTDKNIVFHIEIPKNCTARVCLKNDDIVRKMTLEAEKYDFRL